MVINSTECIDKLHKFMFARGCVVTREEVEAMWYDAAGIKPPGVFDPDDRMELNYDDELGAS